MKKFILSQKGKVKSLDVKSVASLKNKLINSAESNIKFSNKNLPAYDGIIPKNKIKKEEISILSNANLAILKRLTTFAKEEILNFLSDFPRVNKKAIIDIESMDSLTKLKQKLNNGNKSFKRMQKKIINKKNKAFYNSCLNSSELIKRLNIKKRYSLNKKKSIRKIRKRNSVVDIINNHMQNDMINILKEEKIIRLKHISCKDLKMNYEMKKKKNYEQFMNEVEIMKINNSLKKDINFIKLKKKNF